MNNEKSNRKHNVLTEGKLDHIGERLEHTYQKFFKCLSQETEILSQSSAINARELLKPKWGPFSALTVSMVSPNY